MSKTTGEVPVPELDASPPSSPPPSLPDAPAPVPIGPTRKRHRRTKAELEKAKAKETQAAKEAAEASGQPNPEEVAACKVALAGFFEVLSKIVAKRRGPHWVLEPDECTALGDVWGNAAAPYLGRVGKAMPFALAAAITFGTLKPRLERDAELKAELPSAPPQIVP